MTLWPGQTMERSLPIKPVFRSWLMGGFECATMRFDERGRVDGTSFARHDVQALSDYGLLREHGIFSARDALRWHLIERSPGYYDWSSFVAMLRAARQAGVDVVWDLCHFGLPDWADPWSSEIVDRFAAFAGAAAKVFADETDAVPLWSPVNEISFWAYAGGEHGHFAPFGLARGLEWKRQLARMAIHASRELRGADPRARLVHTDPVIHIVSPEPETAVVAEEERLSMFQAWDMIAGMAAPELGGAVDLLDIVGVNFYPSNQWTVGSVRVGFGEMHYRPFSDILGEVARRYQRPLIVAETGAEEPNGAAWLAYTGAEVREAMIQGADIQGFCVYPIMDYPGWTDDRHCRCGLIEVSADWKARTVRTRMARTLAGLTPTVGHQKF